MDKQYHLGAVILLTAIIWLAPLRSVAQVHPDSLLRKAEQLAQDLFYRNHDSTYIRSYADELALRMLLVSKYNFFRIVDRGENASLRYRPDRRINLGIGVSYKWFAVDLVVNVGALGGENFENSRFFDFQGTLFSSKHYISATYQYYLGFRLAGGSINEEEIPESDLIREDIRSIHFGLNYLYAFNYGRFSLKAPFALNEVQRKSAGSIIAGAGFFLNILDADSTMVPENLHDNFDESLLFTDFNTNSLAINAGYAYSFVWKERFFLTLGLVPGINIIAGDYQTGSRQIMDLHVFPKFTTMNAIGYNSRKFYTSFQINGDTDYIRPDRKLRVHTGRGKIKLLVGWRLGGGEQ